MLVVYINFVNGDKLITIVKNVIENKIRVTYPVIKNRSSYLVLAAVFGSAAPGGPDGKQRDAVAGTEMMLCSSNRTFFD